MSKNKNRHNKTNTPNVVPLEERGKTLQDIERQAIEKAQAKADERAKAQAEEVAKLKERYAMRRLNGSDLFVILGILGKLDIKDDFVEMYANNVKESASLQKEALLNDHKEKAPTKGEEVANKLRQIDQAEAINLRGVDIVGTLLSKIMSNAPLIKIELNEFLGSLLGLTGEEVAEMPLSDYFFVLRELFAAEDFKAVFKSASSFLG